MNVAQKLEVYIGLNRNKHNTRNYGLMEVEKKQKILVQEFLFYVSFFLHRIYRPVDPKAIT